MSEMLSLISTQQTIGRFNSDASVLVNQVKNTMVIPNMPRAPRSLSPTSNAIVVEQYSEKYAALIKVIEAMESEQIAYAKELEEYTAVLDKITDSIDEIAARIKRLKETNPAVLPENAKKL